MKNKGFSLIEIVAILIILGVLAAISIPSYFSFIKKSYALEALASLKTYKDQIKACLAAHAGNESVCNAMTFSDSNAFNYTRQGAPTADGSQAWILCAQFIPGVMGFSGSGSPICLTSDENGNVTCGAGDPFTGVC